MMFTKDDLNTTTLVAHNELQTTRDRWAVDASKHTLGRLATRVAMYLSGKHKAYYCKQRDCGDFVVVNNITQVQITGAKLLQKMYYRYSGYKGNLKSMNLRDMLQKKPEEVLRLAVRGMLPKNKLRDKRLKRLKLFLSSSTQFDHHSPQDLPVRG